MKKFTVELHATKDVEIEAETELAAIKLAIEQNPDYYAECVFDSDGNFKAIESCNGCGIDMLEDETGGTDTDGNAYCKECHEASVSEYLRWIHELTLLGYDRGVILSAEHEEDIDELYGDKEPAEALEYLIENNMVTKIP